MQSKRPQAQVRPIAAEVLHFQPERLRLDRRVFVDALRSAARGSAPGPGGMTYDHLKVILDDEGMLGLLGDVAEDLACAEVPRDIANALVLSSMVALRKQDGGVRGIATGATFRRLVGRTLAKQFAPAIEDACSPHQYALSTRAGTDCVGHNSAWAHRVK